MKIRKKLTVMAVMIAMLVAVIPVIPATVAKADSISDAIYYTLGMTQNGVFAEDDEDRYYKFSLPNSGSIHLTGSLYMKNVDLYFYDENAKELWNEIPYWNSTSEVITLDNTIYLTSGTYYFRINNYYSDYGNFNFNIDFTSNNESFMEGNGGSNNTIVSANTVSTDGISYNAQLALNDEKDFWKFSLNESGCVKFNATFYNMKYVNWKLYEENGEELLSETPGWNNTTTNIVVDENLELTKGTYYICVDLDEEYYGRYSFSLLFTSSKETYTETNGGTNNITETASALTVGKSYKGQIAINDEKDFYEFTLSSARSVVVKVESPIEELHIKLYDKNGEELWSDYADRNAPTNKISYFRLTTLGKGTYYAAIERCDSEWCGNYTLEVLEYKEPSNVGDDDNHYDDDNDDNDRDDNDNNYNDDNDDNNRGDNDNNYNDDNDDNDRDDNDSNDDDDNYPISCSHNYRTTYVVSTYFTQGYTIYKCSKCGDTYKGDYVAKKQLGQGYIKSYGFTVGKKKFKMEYLRVDGANGYQIRYSTDKKFKKNVKVKSVGKNTTVKTISKLKSKKKYYVQVRAYVKSGSEIVYGKWSVKRSVKTK